MKKIYAIIMVSMLALFLIGCEKEEKITPVEKGENIVVSENKTNNTNSNSNKNTGNTNNQDYVTVKFSDMYETKGKIKNVSMLFQSLNGKKVHIKGYPAVQSPLDESFVYLNNQQYVTCPFCTIGDVTKLEVIPIYMANGSKIKYTENALDVFGTLEVAEKVDSEGYTTQFRIMADKAIVVESSEKDKAISNYYLALTQNGMIADIQTLQMDIEYITNPEYMAYYDEAYSTGKSTDYDKVTIVKGIIAEHIDRDRSFSAEDPNYNYLEYIKECPGIIKQLEPTDDRLIKVNNDLISLYTDQIVVLEKLYNIINKYKDKENLSVTEAEQTYDELTGLNASNIKLFEKFSKWNNELRES